MFCAAHASPAGSHARIDADRWSIGAVVSQDWPATMSSVSIYKIHLDIGHDLSTGSKCRYHK